MPLSNGFLLISYFYGLGATRGHLVAVVSYYFVVASDLNIFISNNVSVLHDVTVQYSTERTRRNC